MFYDLLTLELLKPSVIKALNFRIFFNIFHVKAYIRRCFQGGGGAYSKLDAKVENLFEMGWTELNYYGILYVATILCYVPTSTEYNVMKRLLRLYFGGFNLLFGAKATIVKAS